MPNTLAVRQVTQEEHLAYVTQASGSFLQTPAWADVKADWGHLNVGWFDRDELVGVALVLLRQTPRIRRFLAYLPEGPVVNWDRYNAEDVSDPLISYLKGQRAFAVKMGPQLIARRWHASTVKPAIAELTSNRISDVPADEVNNRAAKWIEQLRAAGWRQSEEEGAGFGDLQPRYVFQLPLTDRTPDEIFAGFNQLWRRNVRKAEKSGVIVTTGNYDDLAAFHEVYTITAERDGFNPRPLSYFHRMWRAMQAESPDRIRLYLATHEGDVLAATTWVHVSNRVWYSYGASSNDKREMRASNAIQWRMICDAYEVGASVYDLRGISSTLDESDPLFGLLRFKLGTGGDVVEYLGEWDYPISPLIYKAFQFYLARR